MVADLLSRMAVSVARCVSYNLNSSQLWRSSSKLIQYFTISEMTTVI